MGNMKNVSSAIVWSIIVALFGALAFIYNAMSMHVYELTQYPNLFFAYTFGAFLDFLEIGYAVFIIVLIVVFYGDSYFPNDAGAAFHIVAMMYKWIDGTIQILHDVLFIYFIFYYMPFGFGDDAYIYPFIIIVFEVLKLTLIFIGEGFLQTFIDDNYTPSTRAPLFMPLPQHQYHFQMQPFCTPQPAVQVDATPEEIVEEKPQEVIVPPIQAPPQPMPIYLIQQ